MTASATRIEPRSTLSCPHCGHQASETMPIDACQYFYECRGCGAVLKPRPGDCCVYCSYGDTPCPPIQHGGRNACWGETEARVGLTQGDIEHDIP